MTRLFFVGGFLLACSFLAAQPVALSGIVNVYSSVSALDDCDNTVVLAQPAGFSAGMGILLIQMQGAQINESDNASFGNINALNGAGQYEYNRIVSVSGQTVVLERQLRAGYLPSGGLQCVGFSIQPSARVVDTLRPQAWNGLRGGVLALEATDTLYIDAPLVASGAGFRGGASAEALDDNCSVLTFSNRYYYEAGNWRGAAKGEGLARIITGKEFGRGPQANGGGGGNNHNSGGGGGAQASSGGRGGENNEPSFGGCDGFFPGEGGKFVPPGPDRIWMGGGGGAGHRNNDAFTGGGAGGGIVFIKAPVIVSSGGQVWTNGLAGASLQGDGGGGGGAGGLILIFADQIAGSLPLSAQGGGGGSVNNGNQERCMGPGGGGGGGRLLSNLPLLTAQLGGGQAGQTTNSASCPLGTNGATNGQLGTSQTASLVQGDPYQAPALLGMAADEFLCPGASTTLGFVAEGSNISLQWQVFSSSTGSFVDLTEGALYSGVNTDTLQLLPGALAGTYRLVLSSTQQCFLDIVSHTILMEYAPELLADFTAVVNQLSVTLVNNSSMGVGTEYLWDFGDGTTSTLGAPTHTYAQAGTYTISLSLSDDCGSVTTTQSLTVGVPPNALIGATPGGTCLTGPRTVLFENLSTGLYDEQSWSFPGGSPASSTEPSVTVTYPAAGTYTATLSILGPFGTSTASLVVESLPVPAPDFGFEINGLVVSFFNQSQNATQYNWDFGDGTTSTLENPVHTYSSAGTYDVTLNAQQGSCGVATVRSVQLMTTATTEASGADIRVYPNPTRDWVRVSGLSQGTATLYGIQGQLLRQWALSASETPLSLEAIPPGCYLLALQNEKQHTVVLLVVQ